MSQDRRHPSAGWVNIEAMPRGPRGYPLCRQCGVETPGVRRTFCGQACVHAWNIMTNPSYVREQLYLRDQGICQLCGIACGRRAWDADHIVPVIEGGGLCGLDGYRTLCRPCHRGVTAELRGRLALRRREAKR